MKLERVFRPIAAASIAVALAGCVGSAGIAPVAEPIAPAAVGLDRSSVAAGVAPLATDWWRAFGDPQLDALIERALARHPDLAAAQARLRRADALLAGTTAAGGPQVGGQLDATRQRFSATSIYPPPLGGSTRTLATAQLNGSWELDVFGRNRAAIEAAIGAQRAAQADVQAARVVLAGTVASAYAQLGRLFALRRIAERTLQQRDERLALIRQRVRGGLDTNVELRRGEGALPETREQIEALDEQIALARHALAALTVQPPAALDALTVSLADLRAVALPSTLPADLLARRADITAARWRVEAATHDMASAQAQFYPNVNLMAFVGLASIGLDRLVNAGSEQWGVGPAIRLPIFDAGRLRANLRVKAADLDAAIDSYNGAVLAAIRETADPLSALRAIARQQVEQADAQASAEAAYDLATQRYRAGLSTYLTVLDAEAGVLAQRRQAVDLQARALDARFALIRALGGGYAGEPGLAAVHGH